MESTVPETVFFKFSIEILHIPIPSRVLVRNGYSASGHLLSREKDDLCYSQTFEEKKKQSWACELCVYQFTLGTALCPDCMAGGIKCRPLLYSLLPVLTQAFGAYKMAYVLSFVFL